MKKIKLRKTNLKKKIDKTDFSGIDFSSIALVLIVMIGVPIIIFTLLQGYGLLFPVVVILGVVELVGALIVASVIIRYMGIKCDLEALALPLGSIRSIIALSLIIIFVMLSIFMYPNLQPTVKELPYNFTTVYPNGTIISIYNSTSVLVEPSEAEKTFSSQTLTTISTLVVAIASFYFGSRAVESAKQALEPRSTEEKKTEITTNPSELAYTTKENPLFVELENLSKEIDIDDLKVYGDSKGNLEKIEDNIFKYTPSAEADKDVMLSFGATENPDINAKLAVSVSEQNKEKTLDQKTQEETVTAKKEQEEDIKKNEKTIDTS